MPSEIKNSISHRGKALKALKEYFEDAKANDDFQEPENKRPKNFTDTKWPKKTNSFTQTCACTLLLNRLSFD